jgi:cytochrome c oxidase cbb3-type subunit III
MRFGRFGLLASVPAAIAVAALVTGKIQAQNPAPPSGQGKAPTPAAAQTAIDPSLFLSPYPQRPPGDPAAITRGKQLFGVGCGFCHGSDARGGEGGPNLLRSHIVMGDQNGEAIAVVVQNGRPRKGMPKFDLPKDQISDIAAYLHSIKIGDWEVSGQTAINIVVGDAKAGEVYFNGKGKCNSCHSVAGDLAGIGSKSDPKDLQDALVSGGQPTEMLAVLTEEPASSKTAPTTAKITFASGEVVQGILLRVDDFVVSIRDSAGNRRTLRRDGSVPKVEIINPLQAHLDLLRTYTDDDIHNLTAYLVTLK